MSSALVRPVSAIAWELRGAWAAGRRISLSIAADIDRVEGFVESVSATSAFAVVAGLHVPLDRVQGVFRPSRLGDSTLVDGESWAGPIPAALRNRDPDQTSFDF